MVNGVLCVSEKIVGHELESICIKFIVALDKGKEIDEQSPLGVKILEMLVLERGRRPVDCFFLGVSVHVEPLLIKLVDDHVQFRAVDHVRYIEREDVVPDDNIGLLLDHQVDKRLEEICLVFTQYEFYIVSDSCVVWLKKTNEYFLRSLVSPEDTRDLEDGVAEFLGIGHLVGIGGVDFDVVGHFERFDDLVRRVRSNISPTDSILVGIREFVFGVDGCSCKLDPPRYGNIKKAGDL